MPLQMRNTCDRGESTMGGGGAENGRRMDGRGKTQEDDRRTGGGADNDQVRHCKPAWGGMDSRTTGLTGPGGGTRSLSGGDSDRPTADKQAEGQKVEETSGGLMRESNRLKWGGCLAGDRTDTGRTTTDVGRVPENRGEPEYVRLTPGDQTSVQTDTRGTGGPPSDGHLREAEDKHASTLETPEGRTACAVAALEHVDAHPETESVAACVGAHKGKAALPWGGAHTGGGDLEGAYEQTMAT